MAIHLIHLHKVEVNCDKQQLGNVFKNDLSELLQTHFYPKLEKLLWSYDNADYVWTIDQLPIVLNNLNAKHWKTDFLEQGLRQIEAFLRNGFHSKPVVKIQNLSTKTGRQMNKKEHAQKLVAQFLELGVLEPNVLTSTLNDLLKILEVDQQFITFLKLKLKGKIQPILRWSLNIPKQIKLDFLSADGIDHDLNFAVNAMERPSRLNDFLEFLYWVPYFNEGSAVLNQKCLKKIKQVAQHYYNFDEHYVDQLLFQNGLGDLDDAVKTKSTPNTDSGHSTTNQADRTITTEESAAVYVENAGLILLNPFLPKLFSDLGFRENGDWKDLASQHRAALVLQYMVSSNEEFFEHDLPLNKLLCGISIKDTVHTDVELTVDEKELCNHLLSEVIKHWKVLKNTSVKGLQESFIKRSGKLMLNKDKHYELTLDSRGYDILLDQLPWSIGMIKFTWMENTIICNWN